MCVIACIVKVWIICLFRQKLVRCFVCVVAGKGVMAAPYSGTVDGMRSLFEYQRNVVPEYICVPLVMLRRKYQVLSWHYALACSSSNSQSILA